MPWGRGADRGLLSGVERQLFLPSRPPARLVGFFIGEEGRARRTQPRLRVGQESAGQCDRLSRCLLARCAAASVSSRNQETYE